ncbi:MAG: PepSY domain-containing protein [Acidobacteriales bacterium]|nr:PepSY domain-containing protein [Terriglobales bacterium]
MTAPSRPAPQRTLLFRLHLIVGLTVGLLAALLGVSGSLLVFRPELEASLLPTATSAAGKRASLDIAAANVSTAVQGRIASLRLPDSASGLLQFQVTGDDHEARRVFVDPYTGAVVAVQPVETGFFAFVHDFHHDLFAGRNGRVATGVIGALLTALCLTGSLLWWPGRGHVFAKATMVRHATVRRRTAWTIHNTVGFASALLLGVIAFTSTYFTWRESYTKTALALLSQKAQARPPLVDPVVPGSLASIDRIVTQAALADSGAAVTVVRFPSKPGEAISVRLRKDGDLRRIGSDVAFLDPASGEVLRVDLAAARPSAVRFLESFTPIHSGEAGGLGLRLLWVVVGVAPSILFFSGFRLWWKRTIAGNEPTYQAALVAGPASEAVEAA